MVVQSKIILNDFKESLMASEKVLFVTLYEVWKVSLRGGKTICIWPKDIYFHVKATYCNKYNFLELVAAFKLNRQTQIGITVVLYIIYNTELH